MGRQQREQVDRHIREAKEKLEAELESAKHEHQLMLMRHGGVWSGHTRLPEGNNAHLFPPPSNSDLMRRQEELRRLEELRNQELQRRKQIEMR